MAEIWLEADRSPVPEAEAQKEWALKAREVLAEMAQRYGRTIDQPSLATEVQRRSQIVTDQPTRQWMPRVLQRVHLWCVEDAHPPLVALVEGTIKDRAQAEEARIKCYRFHGAKFPDEKPSRAKATKRTPGEAPRSRKKFEPPAHKLCPSCFIELPSTGICDDCD